VLLNTSIAVAKLQLPVPVLFFNQQRCSVYLFVTSRLFSALLGEQDENGMPPMGSKRTCIYLCSNVMESSDVCLHVKWDALLTTHQPFGSVL